MLKSGIVTRPVELFESVQLDMDGATAGTLAGVLNHIFEIQLDKIFKSEQRIVLRQLNDALVEVSNKYNSEFKNNEYVGDTQC
jgi:hypothetical protein